MDLIAIVDGENLSNNGDGKNRYPHSSPLDFGEPF